MRDCHLESAAVSPPCGTPIPPLLSTVRSEYLLDRTAVLRTRLRNARGIHVERESPSCGLREDRTIASPGFEVAAGRRTSTSRGSSLDSQPFLAPAHHLVVRPRECATPVPRPTYEPTNLRRTIPSNNSNHECRDRPSDRIEKPMKPDGLRSKLPALVEMLDSEASLAVGGNTLGRAQCSEHVSRRKTRAKLV